MTEISLKIASECLTVKKSIILIHFSQYVTCITCLVSVRQEVKSIEQPVVVHELELTISASCLIFLLRLSNQDNKTARLQEINFSK